MTYSTHEMSRARAEEMVALADATLAAPRPSPEAIAASSWLNPPRQPAPEPKRLSAPAPSRPPNVQPAPITRAELNRRQDAMERAFGRALGDLMAKNALVRQRCAEAEGRLAAVEARLARLEAPQPGEVRRLPQPKAVA